MHLGCGRVCVGLCWTYNGGCRLAACISYSLRLADVMLCRQGPKVAVVASTEAVEDVAAPLRRCFTHELSIEAPDKDARLSILKVQPRLPLVLLKSKIGVKTGTVLQPRPKQCAVLCQSFTLSAAY